MPSVFITGCPAAGKSTLARRLAKELDGTNIYIDGLKKVMRKDAKLKPWVLFFSLKNEEDYWSTTTAAQHWQNMIHQSEAFWPRVKKVIRRYEKKEERLIVDGANLLPHLMARDFASMPGVVLLPPSKRELFRRLQTEPRWARNNKRLQGVEARRYWAESRSYKREAKKYGFPVFHDADKAFAYLAKKLES